MKRKAIYPPTVLIEIVVNSLGHGYFQIFRIEALLRSPPPSSSPLAAVYRPAAAHPNHNASVLLNAVFPPLTLFPIHFQNDIDHESGREMDFLTRHSLAIRIDIVPGSNRLIFRGPTQYPSLSAGQQHMIMLLFRQLFPDNITYSLVGNFEQHEKWIRFERVLIEKRARFFKLCIVDGRQKSQGCLAD